MEVWAIVVAAGGAVRFGRPKQYAELSGARVLDLAVGGARPHCDGVVVVLPAGDVGTASVVGADALVAGGETRSDSVRAGLAAVPLSAQVIAVHDAARPLATAEIWVAVIDAVTAGADGAIPAVPVTDTLKRVCDGVVVDTVDRSGLVSVQTPQAFQAGALRQAHAGAADATDDAALVEANGGRVVLVAGDPRNIKLTSPGDLEMAAAMAARRKAAEAGT